MTSRNDRVTAIFDTQVRELRNVARFDDIERRSHHTHKILRAWKDGYVLISDRDRADTRDLNQTITVLADYAVNKPDGLEQAITDRAPHLAKDKPMTATTTTQVDPNPFRTVWYGMVAEMREIITTYPRSSAYAHNDPNRPARKEAQMVMFGVYAKQMTSRHSHPTPRKFARIPLQAAWDLMVDGGDLAAFDEFIQANDPFFGSAWDYEMADLVRAWANGVFTLRSVAKLLDSGARVAHTTRIMTNWNIDMAPFLATEPIAEASQWALTQFALLTHSTVNGSDELEADLAQIAYPQGWSRL